MLTAGSVSKVFELGRIGEEIRLGGPATKGGVGRLWGTKENGDGVDCASGDGDAG